MILLDHDASIRRVLMMAVFPGGTWRPGPRSKQSYPGIVLNKAVGVILHSMVGSFASAMARLDSADRASWQFSVCQDGRVYQHYDSLAVTWHAGSQVWNGRLIGIEHEGGAPGNESEPLTDAQKAASVALVRWLAKTHGFPLVRYDGHSGALFEHNQVYATACPSGRISWAEYVEEPMTAEERQKFEALAAAVFDQARWIQGLNAKGNGTFGLALRNQTRIDALEDHTHTLEVKGGDA
ncbi:MAG: N-acetylmuramoyl-L-alanine amidase [Gemmatimonadaceae bacterium]|nr:N-acetylmuramoyl-L-alanine amidase [Gemmatimonadaceae bacterium]